MVVMGCFVSRFHRDPRNDRDLYLILFRSKPQIILLLGSLRARRRRAWQSHTPIHRLNLVSFQVRCSREKQSQPRIHRTKLATQTANREPHTAYRKPLTPLRQYSIISHNLIANNYYICKLTA